MSSRSNSNHNRDEGTRLLYDLDRDDIVDDTERYDYGDMMLSLDISPILYRNFIIMCISFSINHGCVVSCLAYATTMLGDDLGGVGSGVLYVLYSLTAFLVAKPVVSMIGPQKGLLIGATGYCVYIAGFLLSLIIPLLAWPIFIISCAIGGIAGGLLWTSQGRYFSRNAKLYSDESNTVVETVNSNFAGIFAMSYLGLEMVTKVLATIIFLISPNIASFIIFSIYTVLAIISCVFIYNLDDLNELGTREFKTEIILINTLASGKLVLDDIRLALILPFQIAFGFASSFVPFYVLGTIVADSEYLGSTYVGLLSAVIVLTGALAAVPSSYVANRLGKPIVMITGGFCLAFAGFALFLFSDATLGTWVVIVPYLVIYGFGRGTWENTNKAVIADFFSETPDISTAAFAAISFSNGFAGSIGFFSFSSMPRLAMGGLVMISSLVAIGCYLTAVWIDNKNKNDPNSNWYIGISDENDHARRGGSNNSKYNT